MEYGIKIEIHPTKEQEEYLSYCCKVYHNMRNWLVAKYKDCLPRVSKNGIIGYRDIDMYKEYYIDDIPKRIYRSVLSNYGYSLNQFYHHVVSRPPKFHKYNPNKQSFCIVDRRFTVNKYKISLPMYRGCTVSKYIHLDMSFIDKYNITEIFDVHYTKYKNKWYLSGFIKVKMPEKTKKEYIGLDWGIKNFMTTDKGEYINYPVSIVREFQRIKKLQYIKDKKEKDSNNYKKALVRLQNAHERMNYLKRDFIEKKTKELCMNYNICIEDLHLNDIFNSKHKYITRKSVVSPYLIFIKKLKWKCDKYGSMFIKVNPKFTTTQCCVCGNIKEKLDISDRIFTCECCGNTIDRDINAAINIRNRGILYSSNGE